MITYFKQLNENGEIILLLTYNNFHPNITNPLIIEITEEEYNAISAELQAKAEAEAKQAEQEALAAQEEKVQANFTRA